MNKKLEDFFLGKSQIFVDDIEITGVQDNIENITINKVTDQQLNLNKKRWENDLFLRT